MGKQIHLTVRKPDSGKCKNTPQRAVCPFKIFGQVFCICLSRQDGAVYPNLGYIQPSHDFRIDALQRCKIDRTFHGICPLADSLLYHQFLQRLPFDFDLLEWFLFPVCQEQAAQPQQHQQKGQSHKSLTFSHVLLQLPVPRQVPEGGLPLLHTKWWHQTVRSGVPYARLVSGCASVPL